jgi:hypothetical protein
MLPIMCNRICHLGILYIYTHIYIYYKKKYIIISTYVQHKLYKWTGYLKIAIIVTIIHIYIFIHTYIYISFYIYTYIYILFVFLINLLLNISSKLQFFQIYAARLLKLQELPCTGRWCRPGLEDLDILDIFLISMQYIYI